MNGDRNSNRNFETQSLSSNINFPKKNHRNTHNASRLIEKYNNLAREALSNGDKILSESYFQHSDHFIRVQNEKEKTQDNINNEKNKSISDKSKSLKEDNTEKKEIAAS
tara:strand:- start:1231 stop:1557 length:327 start_codon:yes stop_codon:yes gene_type:complete